MTESIVYSQKDDRAEMLKQMAKPLHERLMDQAKAERRRAEHLRGCLFTGEWPGASHLRQASMLEEAAIKLQSAEAAKTNRRRKKEQAK